MHRFDWRRTEDKINSFPSFTHTVHSNNSPFTLHFLALFSSREDAIPIMLNHGWPGSFLEFLPILQLFKEQYTPETLPYHLIVTSMPGYGFSTPPPQDRELGALEVPKMFDELMRDLGFEGYVAHGGDIGSRISRILAAEHEGCKAVHLNFGIIKKPENVEVSSLSPTEQVGVARGEKFATEGTGKSNGLLESDR
jgi:microsomal epoxide hydrolase